jgi:dipeptidyl aminopeptidase/acylaminoacyl peptidase
MTRAIPADSKKTLSPFGAWPSAISSALVVSDSIILDEAKLTENALFYIERRPQQAGRCVIVEVTNGIAHDILPAPFSARSRVHEYGGGSYCIDHELIFFINDNDQEIYCINKNQINRVTRSEKKRFADISYDRRHNRLIAICESHTQSDNNKVVTNSIVSIDADTGVLTTLQTGGDFYASPRLNISATQLCWQTWNHPNMPWDGNQLWLADIDSAGQLVNHKYIAGAEDVSVFQPQWSPDNVLYFISDDTGWWHINRYLADRPADNIERLTDGEREFGLPQWVFAQSTYAFISKELIICCYRSHGENTLATLSLADKPSLNPITTNWQEFNSITACNDTLCFIAASSQAFPQLVLATISSKNPYSISPAIIKTSSQLPVSEAYYAKAQAVTFSNRHQQTVYANYYPPTNPDYQADGDELPPLIVICHGGPTAQSSIELDPKKQFWTSRGFALLDVNYSGSSGYGREYRSRLNNKWGELDVEDCCDAALYAVSNGLADQRRLIIRGSSAGGYTVLCALTFAQVFSAGASYYGISELTSLASDTHKFESHYLDRLIGPYPEAKILYQQRSPINHSDRLNCPVIFFQGIDDHVVPKVQAEKMFAALSRKGLPVAAQYFAGEQHGFRKAETIIMSLENELSFYRLIFKLAPAEGIGFIGDIQLDNII